MAEGIELTKDEQIAKDYFIFLHTKGSQAPCTITPAFYDLPPWYDPKKFRRGQRYFRENRLPILFSNLTGLLSLLFVPKGLKILMTTTQSGTPEAARKRYLATLAYTIAWYETDLAPGSKSYELLKHVRNMHYYASIYVNEKGIGHISQADISSTAFGFMGFALGRPQALGMSNVDREGQEALAYFWAVICYMLGVEDRFNMCLLPFDALVIFCHMIIRYSLIPLVQMETPEFQQMSLAIVGGIKSLIPTLDHESQMFQAKRLLEVPGYQYKVDIKQEVLCRSILSQKDLDCCSQALRDTLFDGLILMTEDIPIIEVVNGSTNYILNKGTKLIGSDMVINDRHNTITSKYLSELRNTMKLDDRQHLIIEFIQYEREWETCLNSSKFSQMGFEAKSFCRLNHLWIPFYRYKVGKYLFESLLNFYLKWVKLR